ncbi:MAG: hypothetical protein HY433_00915 [Candidatus Liptonbacteria bacterium]|nr:hypothetical protein [Candidatus Liptonbacteria bacterium]
MPSKAVWNMGLSILDPEAERIMERLAAAIPPDSPLRSEIVSRIFAVVKAWAESGAESIPGLGGVLIEKASDYGDFLVANLTGSGRGQKKSVSPQDWMDRFLADAGERLKKAPTPEAARTETEKIRAEFELRRGLVEMVEQVRREAAPMPTSEVVPIDWVAMQAKLIAVIGTAAAIVDGIAKKVAVPVGKFADWLESQRGGKR